MYILLNKSFFSILIRLINKIKFNEKVFFNYF